MNVLYIPKIYMHMCKANNCACVYVRQYYIHMHILGAHPKPTNHNRKNALNMKIGRHFVTPCFS